MSQDTQRPLLYGYFQSTANLLLADYQRSKGQEASSNIGYNRELLCSRFLERVLPPRLTLRRGEIWDSQGNRTGQLEIIILRDDAVSLTFGEADTFLAEGVFAAIEVKSNLTRDKMREALDTLRRVKCLAPAGRTSIKSGHVLDRALRCVFAYEGASWDTLLQEDANGVADLICILNRGILIARDLLLKWEGDSPFLRMDGKAAALGYLYYHLITYSTSFMGRTFSLAPYFQPFSAWREG